MADGLRSRIAPTPSGFLHAGNGMNFILTWALTRASGGKLLLRIDDLDKARYRQEYVDDVFSTLEWLGIDYDEGPGGVADFEQNWSQHNRLPRYQKLLTELRSNQQLFACSCSRKDIREASADGRYPGTCQSLQLSFDAPATAWRIKPPAKDADVDVCNWENGPEAFRLQELDAFVVRQKNELPAYQIASLADDLYFGINLIVRGKDLWPSTLSQLYLAKLLHQQDFLNCCFLHHPLMRDDSGQKMSKSAGADALKSWRQEGRPASFLYQMVAPILKLPIGISDGPGLVEAIKERYLEN